MSKSYFQICAFRVPEAKVLGRVVVAESCTKDMHHCCLQSQEKCAKWKKACKVLLYQGLLGYDSIWHAPLCRPWQCPWNYAQAQGDGRRLLVLRFWIHCCVGFHGGVVPWPDRISARARLDSALRFARNVRQAKMTFFYRIFFFPESPRL